MNYAWVAEITNESVRGSIDVYHQRCDLRGGFRADGAGVLQGDCSAEKAGTDGSWHTEESLPYERSLVTQSGGKEIIRYKSLGKFALTMIGFSGQMK